MGKRRSWILPASLAVPIAVGWLYAVGVFYGMAGGKSWPVGYYGKFNRVRSTIERMPEVRIVNFWQHTDITLEDFSFTVVSGSHRPATVYFHQNSPQMEMTPKQIEDYVRSVCNPQPQPGR